MSGKHSRSALLVTAQLSMLSVNEVAFKMAVVLALKDAKKFQLSDYE